jgi:hypothetical protein
MSNVTYRATLNAPATTSALDFDVTPIAPFYISEVLIYLNTSYPPPSAYGKIKTGSATNPSHLTIFVEQAIFDQITGCLGGSAVDLTIEYNSSSLVVSNVFGVAEALRALLLDLNKKVDKIGEALIAMGMYPGNQSSGEGEISGILDKTGSED